MSSYQTYLKRFPNKFVVMSNDDVLVTSEVDKGKFVRVKRPEYAYICDLLATTEREFTKAIQDAGIMEYILSVDATQENKDIFVTKLNELHKLIEDLWKLRTIQRKMLYSENNTRPSFNTALVIEKDIDLY